MTEPQSKYIDTWNDLEKNFAISKSHNKRFISIGSDHALEQENKVMKVTGGVKGLTQNSSGLHRFCLTAPVLNSMLKEFFSLKSNSSLSAFKRSWYIEVGDGRCSYFMHDTSDK